VFQGFGTASFKTGPLHCTVACGNLVQYSIVEYSIVQYSIVQYSTVQ
jgi:hypothetical protein